MSNMNMLQAYILQCSLCCELKELHVKRWILRGGCLKGFHSFWGTGETPLAKLSHVVNNGDLIIK